MDSRSSSHRSSHHSSSRSSRRYSRDRSSSRHSSERTNSPEPRGEKRSREDHHDSRRHYENRHHRRHSRDEKRRHGDEGRQRSSRYDDKRSSRHYHDDRDRSRSSYTSRDKRREPSRSRRDDLKAPLPPKTEAESSSSLPNHQQPASSVPADATTTAYYSQQDPHWGYYGATGDMSWAGYPPGSEHYNTAYYGQHPPHTMDPANPSAESYYSNYYHGAYAQYYASIPPPPPDTDTQQQQQQQFQSQPANVEATPNMTEEAEDDNMMISPPARQATYAGVPESVLEEVGYPLQTADDPATLYEKIGQVGEGTYGKVYKARNCKTGELMALKRVRMKNDKDGFPITAMREIKQLQNLKHDRIVQLQQVMVAGGSLYMVLEYMDHDLSGILDHPKFKFEASHAKSLTKQMLEGVAYLHHMGILHRDIKGSNLLVNNRGELKIADFGLARMFQKNRAHDYTNRVITLWYRPPELLLGATAYGPEVDVWSVGCIMLEFFAGKPMFKGVDEITQLEAIYRIMGTPDPETWPSVKELPWFALIRPKEQRGNKFKAMFESILTPGALALAEALLSMNPKDRPSAARALEFDYFTAEEPEPVMPANLLNINGDWHEFESKQRKQSKTKQQQRQPQKSHSRPAHSSNDARKSKSVDMKQASLSTTNAPTTMRTTPSTTATSTTATTSSSELPKAS